MFTDELPMYCQFWVPCPRREAVWACVRCKDLVSELGQMAGNISCGKWNPLRPRDLRIENRAHAHAASRREHGTLKSPDPVRYSLTNMPSAPGGQVPTDSGEVPNLFLRAELLSAPECEARDSLHYLQRVMRVYSYQVLLPAFARGGAMHANSQATVGLVAKRNLDLLARV